MTLHSFLHLGILLAQLLIRKPIAAQFIVLETLQVLTLLRQIRSRLRVHGLSLVSWLEGLLRSSHAEVGLAGSLRIRRVVDGLVGRMYSVRSRIGLVGSDSVRILNALFGRNEAPERRRHGNWLRLKQRSRDRMAQKVVLGFPYRCAIDQVLLLVKSVGPDLLLLLRNLQFTFVFIGIQVKLGAVLARNMGWNYVVFLQKLLMSSL